MIDSHCHLDHEPLLSNLSEIISRSKSSGIEKLLTICTTNSGYENILNILNLDSIIYGTYGIHPHETNNDLIDKDEIVKKVLLNKKIIGVGESGLDFYYNNSHKDSQLKSFKNHIDASLELDIPIIVHSRNAEKETFELLNNYKDTKLKILMHCFTGSTDLALNLLPLNAYFSASGIITFKNSLLLQDTFKKIPEDKLLIETDSPFLSPEPNRGKKNEPAYIKFTAQKLANLRNMEVEKLIKITTKNFNTLFF